MGQSGVIAITPSSEFDRTLRTAMTAAGADIRVFASVSELGPGPLSAELMFFHIARGDHGGPSSTVAEIAAAAERLPEKGQVVAVVPRGDLATSVAAMRAHPRVVGVLAMDHLRLSDLTATATRLLLGNVFGLEKVLPWGARVHQIQVGDYPEKAAAVQQISSFAQAVGLRRMHRERIERCCDEMIMNAIYDAPIGPDGSPIARPRAHTHPSMPRGPANGSGAFQLAGQDRATVEFGYDGRRFAVAVRDRFGRFERDTLIRYLDKCLNSDQQIDHRAGGGAGLGLYMMSRSASSLMFNLRPGAATECICIFDVEAPRPELDQIGVFQERASERAVSEWAEATPLSPPTPPLEPSTVPSGKGPRRQILLLALAIAAVLAAVIFVLVSRDRRAAGVAGSCDQAGRGIGRVWPARKPDVERAFATSTGGAGSATGEVSGFLDRYAASWTSMAVKSCEATRAGEQTAQVDELRSSCLADRQRELSDMVDVLARADARAVEHATDSIHALAPVSQCEASALLGRGVALPEEPARRAAIEKVRGLVSRAAANIAVERGPEAKALLDEATKDLPLASYQPIESELRLTRGRLEVMWGNFAAAKGEMLRASELAESAGYDLARARALVDLVYVVGYELQDFEQGELFVRMARGPLQKAGGDRSLEATLLRNAGMVSHAARDYQRARERQLASLGIREKLYGPESAQAAEVLTDLAGSLRELGQRDEALARVRKAVEIDQRLFGKANRAYARAITELGHVLASRGDFDEARKVYQEGVDVAYGTLAADHPLVAIALVNRGNIELLAGEPADAIPYYEKALAIESKALGPDHLQVAASLMNLGAARESAGQLVEAERSYGRALAIRTRHLGEHHALVGESVGAVGLVELGRGKMSRAIEDLERAVALAEENRDVSERIGELRFGLARALWQGRGDRDRARELGRRAVEELTTAKADDEAAEARAWVEQR